MTFTLKWHPQPLERAGAQLNCPIASQGLSATVYTQVSDVEDEVNGLVTYDRRVVKADVARMRALAAKMKF